MKFLCFSGPFFRYRTYEDFIQNSNSPNVPMKDFVLNRLRHVPVIAVSFLVLTQFFNIEVSNLNACLKC